MGQKVHPIGFRVGSYLIWKDHWYSFNYSDLSYKNISFYNYIKQILFNEGLILGDINIIHKLNSILLNISYYKIDDFKFVNNSSYIQDKKRISKLILNTPNNFISVWDEIELIAQYYFKIPIQINYYVQLNKFNHVNYITGYLRIKLESSIFNRILYNYLKNDFEEQNICFALQNLYGINYFYLMGIKLECNGRLKGTKNTISVIEKDSIGSLPIQSKYHYISYNQEMVNTKHGVYGIKVWLAYTRVKINK